MKELLPSSHNQYLSDETSSTTVPQIIMHLAALTLLCEKEAQEGKFFILCSIWIMVHIGPYMVHTRSYMWLHWI